MDAVQAADSGHPGTPMALAPAAYVIWKRFLRFNPQNPDWPDRDRFVLSCGHASMLLYSLLYLTGYDVSLDDVEHFRQWGSKTPGHPERGDTPGVEVTTGPLGQGFANAVGMAIAERYLAHRFNRDGFPIVDHRVWGFCSDGDLMEGVSSEAASLAGHLQLGTINFVYDDNHITIEGSTALAFTENVGARFEAYGWHVQHVADGNDLRAIEAACAAAEAETGRPSLIVLRTVIGNPAPDKQGTAEAHGSPLGVEEIRKTKEILGWPPDQPFMVPDGALDDMRQAVDQGAAREAAWRELMNRFAETYPEEAAEFQRWLDNDLPNGWEKSLPQFPTDKPVATRQASGAVLNAIAGVIPNLVGGSADLAGSTGTEIKGAGDFEPGEVGRNFHWGVREHGMVAALNGMAAHGGLRPYGSSFLVFTDYCKPSLRLAAIMHLPIVFIGTHDSIGLGEDGPTHQPIEQLAMLRAMPTMWVFRPADATETAQAWRAILERTDGPTTLVLTRQKLPVLDRTRYAPADGVLRGGYILHEPDGGPQAILIATGSEVEVALGAAEKLAGEGIKARVVSLPCWELFDQQPQEYRDRVLPPAIRARVSIEAAATFGWQRWVTDGGAMLGIDHFGASAPAARLYKEFHITADHAAELVKQVLQRRTA